MCAWFDIRRETLGHLTDNDSKNILYFWRINVCDSWAVMWSELTPEVMN